MAAKPKITYHCRECGASATKWAGQCQDCGGWNTLDESTTSSSSKVNRYSGYADQASSAEVQVLSKVEAQCLQRINTGMGELDRVLGGGVVPGSAILIGGDPGIGKSTLLLQSLSSLAQRTKTLYVTGEESAQQVSMRATRLQLPVDQVNILCEISLETILATAEKMSSDVLVIDSIQTVFSEEQYI